ncbi:MAG: ATP phosphoribosyltransferase regulatory subunit, partial [Sneathiella sp.]|nr:ATP phosphoribosyltransferase regulatory subunit [Sneathiella sp.]
DETAASAREALDHKDAAALAGYAPPLANILIALLKAAGPAKAAIAALDALSLPKKAAEQVEGLKCVVEQLAEAAPDLELTIDPGEYRGFEYQTGLSFTVFARGVRGELGRGGRYLLMDNEPASGFTLFLDSLMRAVPRKISDDRLYLPFETSLNEGYALRTEGWKTVAGLAPEEDIETEARRLHCGHILGPYGIKKLS